MDELTIDELKQLVVFYRNRSIELETQLLASQLKASRVVAEAPAPKPVKTKE